MPGNEINLPNLVSSLNIDLSGLRGAVADGARQGTAIGAAIGEGVRDRLDAAVTALPRVQIHADNTEVERDLIQVHRQLAQLSTQRIGIDVPVGQALRELDTIQATVDRLAQTHPDVPVRAQIGQALAALNLVRDAANHVDDDTPVITPQVDPAPAIAETALLRRALARLGDDSGGLRRTLGTLPGVLAPVASGLGLLGKAAFLPQLVGATASLANLAPAAGVAATGILAAGSAMATLKLGTAGLSDAIGGDADALAKLAPSARQFVGSIKAITPEFTRVRAAIQQSLFADLGPTLERLARTTLPSVQAGLTTTAGSLNLMGRATATALDQLAKTGTLRTALTGVGKDLGSLQRLPGQFITGLVQIGSAAEPVFGRITGLISRVADSVSGKLGKAFKGGGLAASISDAADLVGQLVTTFENFGIAIGNIFGPALSSGSSFLGTLANIGKSLASITGTKAAQETFTQLFTTLHAVSGLISTTLSAALRAVMPLLSSLVGALAGPLQSLAKTLAPVLSKLVGTLGKALQPVVSALGKGLATLAPVIGTLATALGGALTPVLGVAGELLADLIPPIAAIIGQVGTALAPVLTQLGQIVAQVGTALLNLLAPILAQLPALIGPIITIAGTLLTVFGGVVAQLLGALQPAFTSIGQALGTLAVALTPVITLMAQGLGKEIGALVPILTPVILLVGKLAAVLANQLASFITKVVVPAVKAVSDLLKGHFSDAAHDAEAAIKGLVSNALDNLVRLPEKAARALAPLAVKLLLAASNAGAQLVAGLVNKMAVAVTAVAGLPGRATKALGSLGGKLYSAGAELIAGFVRGIVSKITSVRSTLTNLTSNITAWKGPPKKDAVLLTPAGKSIIQGLINGIDASTAGLKSRLGSITTLIQRAITVNAGNRHKVSGLGGLADLISVDNKKLLNLAAARDAVAARLKKAQANLTALQKASADVASKVSGGILSDANITSGTSGFATIAGITQGLTTSAAQAKQFAGQIAQLKKEGLSPELLQQLADAGVSGGEAAAKALASATPAQIKAINAQQQQLDAAAKSTGTTVANSLYASGIQAAKGIVAGLESQEGALEKQMEKLADVMVGAIDKKLGIHSPATALIPTGQFSGEGIAVGLRNRFAMIREAATAAGQLVAQAAQGAAAALDGVPTAGQLRPLVAGSAPAPYQPVNHFHLYGSDAGPAGISRQLAWDAKVGRR